MPSELPHHIDGAADHRHLGVDEAIQNENQLQLQTLAGVWVERSQHILKLVYTYGGDRAPH